MYDVIVIGAGFAGSVIAREMADFGKKVLMLEKRGHVGGNMYEDLSPANIRVHRYGPHIFHTNSARVYNYLKRFSNWYAYTHRVLGKIEGKLVPIPFNFTSIEQLFSRKEAEKLQSELLNYLPKDARVSVFDLINHPKGIIRDLGNFICEKVFINYSAKQWGISIEEIDKTTINRVPVVIGYDDKYFQDLIQMMPSDGFTSLITEILSHENIDISLNINAKQLLRIDFDGNEVIFDNKKFNGMVFFTGAIDELMDYKFGILPYRSLNLVFEDYPVEYYQSNSVINYPNEESFTRITEFKHFAPTPASPPVKGTTILKEYPVDFVPNSIYEPLYPIISDKSAQIYAQYLNEIKKVDRLYLCGRLAEYKYYNMDSVILNALTLSDETKQYNCFNMY